MDREEVVGLWHEIGSGVPGGGAVSKLIELFATAVETAARERAHNAGFVEASRIHGAEIDRLRAALLIGHTYAECCPTPSSPDDRDQDCQACVALGPNPSMKNAGLGLWTKRETNMSTWKEHLEDAMKERGEELADLEANTLMEADIMKEFDSGHGVAEGVPFTAWSARTVYFPICKDGAEWVGAVSRHPDGKPTEHQGGG